MRSSGVTDTGDIVVEMGSRLENYLSDFDKTFVGPWDVANKVADILFRLLNVESSSCGCNTELIIKNIPKLDDDFVQLNPDIITSRFSVSSIQLKETIDSLSSSMFSRYNLLRDFLEGVRIINVF